MAEVAQLTFTHKEVVTALLKQQGIHEGIWQLIVNFSLGAAFVGPNDGELNPAAVVPVSHIGIQKTDRVTNLSVDAAEVNPRA